MWENNIINNLNNNTINNLNNNVLNNQRYVIDKKLKKRLIFEEGKFTCFFLVLLGLILFPPFGTVIFIFMWKSIVKNELIKRIYILKIVKWYNKKINIFTLFLNFILFVIFILLLLFFIIMFFPFSIIFFFVWILLLIITLNKYNASKDSFYIKF